MSLVKCSECGLEISDKSKNCVHCGCPVKREEVKIITNKNLFLFIISAVCFVLSMVFLMLALFASTDTRTMFFTNNKYYLAAVREIGSYDKRETIDGFTYHHRLNAYDDIVLELMDDAYECSFTYYLSNAEMKIEFKMDYKTYVTYKMTKNGLEISDRVLATEAIVRVAEAMRNLLDSIINIDLDKACTVNDILNEYYGYCSLVNSIRISGSIFCALLFSGFIASIGYYVVKLKSKKHCKVLSQVSAEQTVQLSERTIAEEELQ